ncbi:MAG: hypothetical protein ACT6FE_00840 [Methanosarcinaceae archaeon]
MFGVDSTYSINDKKLSWLSPILDQWLRINRDYIEEYDCEDSLYWYNERANISALAGAVWKCGGFAMEEYSSEKGKGKNKKSGRIDLYLYFSENEAISEAKMNWLYLYKNFNKDFGEIVEKSMKDAMSDLKTTFQSNSADFGFAISFFVPHWKSGLDSSELMIRFKEHVEDYECSFYAWFNNKSGKDILSSGDYVYNSVVMIGQTLPNILK